MGPSDANFCHACGVRQVRDARFCHACGTQLAFPIEAPSGEARNDATSPEGASRVLEVDGVTYRPGVGKFAGYWMPESGGSWFELRDGVMVRTVVGQSRFWGRLPTFWKVILVLLAITSILGVMRLVFTVSLEFLESQSKRAELSESEQQQQIYRSAGFEDMQKLDLLQQRNLCLVYRNEGISGVFVLVTENSPGLQYRLARAYSRGIVDFCTK